MEGDELTGVCLPGQQTEASLLTLLAIPATAALAIASIFFLAGLVASLVTPSDATRRLLARVSVLFVLYSLPQSCVVGSLVYEVIERRGWRAEATARPNLEVFCSSSACSWCWWWASPPAPGSPPPAPCTPGAASPPPAAASGADTRSRPLRSSPR